jgi:hypothetical protein
MGAKKSQVGESLVATGENKSRERDGHVERASTHFTHTIGVHKVLTEGLAPWVEKDRDACVGHKFPKGVGNRVEITILVASGERKTSESKFFDRPFCFSQMRISSPWCY